MFNEFGTISISPDVAKYAILAFVVWVIFAPFWGRIYDSLVASFRWAEKCDIPSLTAAEDALFFWCGKIRRFLVDFRARHSPKFYRRVQCVFAANQRHSGLTLYEEWERDIDDIPDPAARTFLRHQIARYKPSDATIARARRYTGLKMGDIFGWWRYDVDNSSVGY